MKPAKSEFLESVPDGWTESRFGLEMVIEGGLVDPEIDPWRGLPLIAPNHIERGTGRLLELQSAFEQGASSGKYVAPLGVIAYSKIRPKLNKVALVPQKSLISADMYALRSRKGDDHGYLRYFMLAEPFNEYVAQVADRVKMPKVNREELSDAPWLRPPIEQQRRIADYLDHETATIDTLIEKQQSLAGLLQERRMALPDELLISAQGATMQLRHVVDEVVDCPHWTPETVDDETYSAVRSGSIRNGKYRHSYSLHVDRETFLARSGALVRSGDVLFAREAPAGEACLVPEGYKLCLGQRTVLLRVNPRLLIGKVLLANLYSRSVQDYFALNSYGSTVANVRLPVLRATTLKVPPLDEQRRIANHLDEETAKIDALIVKAERFIELARERRAALITAAVTGQISVD